MALQGVGNLTSWVVECIATDHSPHTVEEKTNDNIWNAIPGFTGMEASVPLMLTQVNAGRLTLTLHKKEHDQSSPTLPSPPRRGRVRVRGDFTVGEIWFIDKNEDITQ